MFNNLWFWDNIDCSDHFKLDHFIIFILCVSQAWELNHMFCNRQILTVIIVNPGKYVSQLVV